MPLIVSVEVFEWEDPPLMWAALSHGLKRRKGDEKPHVP